MRVAHICSILEYKVGRRPSGRQKGKETDYDGQEIGQTNTVGGNGVYYGGQYYACDTDSNKSGWDYSETDGFGKPRKL